MIVATAYNEKFKEVGDFSKRSIDRYCSMPRRGSRCPVIQTIPEDFDRPPSWFKVQMILGILPHTDFVLWIDADAMIVGEEDLQSMLAPVTLNIARDVNGINHGVCAWRNCEQSFDILERVENMYEQYKDGPWFEQHAVMELLPEIDVKYQPKAVFNAYPEGVPNPDATDCSQIIHWPGMSIEERIPLMKLQAAKLGL